MMGRKKYCFIHKYSKTPIIRVLAVNCTRSHDIKRQQIFLIYILIIGWDIYHDVLKSFMHYSKVCGKVYKY